MGTLLACTSLVANAAVSGDGSLAPRTAAGLPEPFIGVATGAYQGGASVVITPTALVSAIHPLTGGGLAVPTGQSDDVSLERDTDGAVAPTGTVPAAPDENAVVASPDPPPPVEPVPEVPGDEPEGSVAPVLQPVTELLAPTGVTEATDPALSMLDAPLFA